MLITRRETGMKHSISLIINGDPVDAIVKDNLIFFVTSCF